MIITIISPSHIIRHLRDRLTTGCHIMLIKPKEKIFNFINESVRGTGKPFRRLRKWRHFPRARTSALRAEKGKTTHTTEKPETMQVRDRTLASTPELSVSFHHNRPTDTGRTVQKELTQKQFHYEENNPHPRNPAADGGSIPPHDKRVRQSPH